MARDNSYERFVEVWEESNSVVEVAEKLGISRWSAHQTAAKLRAAGVKLKPMRRNPIRSEPNVDALNALIEAKRR